MSTILRSKFITHRAIQEAKDKRKQEIEKQELKDSNLLLELGDIDKHANTAKHSTYRPLRAKNPESSSNRHNDSYDLTLNKTITGSTEKRFRANDSESGYSRDSHAKTLNE